MQLVIMSETTWQCMQHTKRSTLPKTSKLSQGRLLIKTTRLYNLDMLWAKCHVDHCLVSIVPGFDDSASVSK